MEYGSGRKLPSAQHHTSTSSATVARQIQSFSSLYFSLINSSSHYSHGCSLTHTALRHTHARKQIVPIRNILFISFLLNPLMESVEKTILFYNDNMTKKHNIVTNKTEDRTGNENKCGCVFIKGDYNKLGLPTEYHYLRTLEITSTDIDQSNYQSKNDDV